MYTYNAKVDRVVDGDTVDTLNEGHGVEYHGGKR